MDHDLTDDDFTDLAEDFTENASSQLHLKEIFKNIYLRGKLEERRDIMREQHD